MRAVRAVRAAVSVRLISRHGSARRRNRLCWALNSAEIQPGARVWPRAETGGAGEVLRALEAWMAGIPPGVGLGSFREFLAWGPLRPLLSEHRPATGPVPPCFL